MNITGLYRVQVSEKYRFLPQRFNFSFLEGVPLFLCKYGEISDFIKNADFFYVKCIAGFSSTI